MECFAHLFFLAFVGASSAFRIAFPFPPNTVQSTPTAQAGGPVITRLAALFVDAPVKNMQGASYGFLGCFIESAESYIGSVVVTLPLMTPETCSNFCLTWNYFSLARGMLAQASNATVSGLHILRYRLYLQCSAALGVDNRCIKL